MVEAGGAEPLWTTKINCIKIRHTEVGKSATVRYCAWFFCYASTSPSCDCNIHCSSCNCLQLPPHHWREIQWSWKHIHCDHEDYIATPHSLFDTHSSTRSNRCSIPKLNLEMTKSNCHSQYRWTKKKQAKIYSTRLSRFRAQQITTAHKDSRRNRRE